MSDEFQFRPEIKKKSIRSYVIRAGRITEGQRKAFDTYWDQFGLSLNDGQLDLAATFGRSAPTVLEVGFGMGDSLLAMAEQEPEKNFIGIEVHPPGVGSLISQAGKHCVSNLRVFMADAVDVLSDCIVPASIARFQLYFPDPWHKKKHNKRRIVQPAFIDLVNRALQPEGLLHMATDWEPYAEQMMEILTADERWANTNGEHQYSERPDFRPVTKFEQRGARLGHGVWDLLFQKKN